MVTFIGLGKDEKSFYKRGENNSEKGIETWLPESDMDTAAKPVEERIEQLVRAANEGKEMPLDYDSEIVQTILGYAKRMEKLDIILTAITKDYCAGYCERGPGGCCHCTQFATRDIPVEMRKMQMAEAKSNGAGEIDLYNNVKCAYHSPEGCYMQLMKSPKCTGTLCGPLTTYISDIYGHSMSDVFVSDMNALACEKISDHDSLFDAMDRAIESGQRLAYSKGCQNRKNQSIKRIRQKEGNGDKAIEADRKLL